MLRPAGIRRRRLRAVDRRRARGRRAGARLLRPRQAELCRPHRHRLHPRQRPRDLSQAQAAGASKAAVRGPLPPDERGVNKPVWVEPKLVAEVDFHGWTHGDRVRQASFQGLREDKPAKEVVREVKAARRHDQSAGQSAAPCVKTRNADTRRQGEAHPSRPRLLGGRRRHQARSRRLLQQGLEMDAAACRRPADRAGALPGGRRGSMLLPEARARRHPDRVSPSGAGEGRQDHLHRRSRRA